MRRLRYSALILALAVAVHIDWHLARPAHHRLSGNWPHHWLFAAAAFALVGWLIARWWPERPTRAAAGIVGLALVLAQGVEPVVEVAMYQHQLGYPTDPGRWTAFALCVAAGIPALLVTLILCRPRLRRYPVAPAA
ncbi:MAG: hypothetical protein H7124_06875 [Phycisphaerales bacterium]|nr:hypothetical protein [Hyphomonadaceae bacterium]